MGSFLLLAFLAALTPARCRREKDCGRRGGGRYPSPWGVKLPARIDTGAAISSLDAQDLSVKDGFAEFRLPQKYGGMKLRLPIADWRNIRSSEASEQRPIVEIEICIGSRRVLARVNLNDRSSVKYPLLIGRDALRENFIVDCKQERCSPPSCPEVPLK